MYFLNIFFLYSAAYVFDYVCICFSPVYYKAWTTSDMLTGTELVRVPVQAKGIPPRIKHAIHE